MKLKFRSPIASPDARQLAWQISISSALCPRVSASNSSGHGRPHSDGARFVGRTINSTWSLHLVLPRLLDLVYQDLELPAVVAAEGSVSFVHVDIVTNMEARFASAAWIKKMARQLLISIWYCRVAEEEYWGAGHGGRHV